jgi:hypothetical protein
MTCEIFQNELYRQRGINLVSLPGGGKTVILGRVIAMSDILNGIPTVVLDPGGDTIDHIIDCLMRLENEEQRAALFKRIVYVNMAGGEDIVSVPLYYRLGGETNFIIGERFPNVILRIDAALASAAIQGMNAVRDDCRKAAPRLLERGWQVTEMRSVLKSVADALSIKLQPFEMDENMKAIYGGTAGIDWERFEEEKQIILFDFRDVHDDEMRRFSFTWVFRLFIEFIKYRGTYNDPVSFIVDELSIMHEALRNTGIDFFKKDMEELALTIMRRFNVWVTVAYQSLDQFRDSPRTQNILLSNFAIQMVGIENHDESAELLARRFFHYDKDKLREVRERYLPAVYQSESDPDIFLPTSNRYREYVRKLDPTPLTISEQLHTNAERFRQLERFKFLVKIDQQPVKKGWVDDELPDMKDPALKELIAYVRMKLAQKSGRPRDEVLAEIEARTQANRHGQEISGPSNQQQVGTSASQPKQPEQRTLVDEQPKPGPKVPPKADNEEPQQEAPKPSEPPKREPKLKKREDTL